MIILAETNCSVRSSAQGRKRGFTLTEIAIVLGIIGLILGAVWSAAGNVYSNANATKFAEQLGVYIAAARNVCQNGCGAAGTNIPAVSASLPTLPGVAANATQIGPNVTSVFNVSWSGVPASTAGANFCNAMESAISQLGGTPGSNAQNAYNASTNNAATPGCANGNAAAYTCGGTVGNYTYTPASAANCVGGVAPPGATCNITANTNLCGGNAGPTLAGVFPLSF